MFTSQSQINDLFNDSFDSAFSEEFDTGISEDSNYAYLDDKFPVDIVQFAEDPKFLNLKGSLYKEIKNFLIDLEDPAIREIDMILGKGSGKSTIATIFSAYGCYKLLQMKNPQATFQLTPQTPIYSINVSISAKQAKDTVFSGISYLIEHSPYFKNLKPTIGAETIALPKNIFLFCGHSNSAAFLGYPTYRAVMDEVNFMTDTNNRSVSKKLYNALRGSLKTRFPNSYKILSISSDSLPNSFLRERLSDLKLKKLKDEQKQNCK